MDRIKVLKRLEDMMESINSINSFVARYPKRFEIFHSEPMFRAAVLYHIAIIGEALNCVVKIMPDIRISSIRQIISTRNYIIHGYDSLDDEILWSIVINHLPKLKNEIEMEIRNISINQDNL